MLMSLYYFTRMCCLVIKSVNM